ncbi:MFS transporter [Vibrio lamellibrachiae]|uniref:MFS transporter n=1 Tax=Vibrio lamellibrachiae TaxID=2910253 RepID=UPI003D152C60
MIEVNNPINPSRAGFSKWTSLIVLILAQLGTLLDLSTMQVSVDALTTNLGASMPEIQFANATYAMLAASLMIVGGFTGLIIGWRKQFKLGLILAVTGSIFAAFSPNITVFILAGRGITAIGACLLIPSVLAHIPALYQGKDRGLAFAVIAACLGVLAAVAPIVQGVIVDVVGLSAAYLIVASYFALVLVSTRFLDPLPLSKHKVKVDTVGILLSCTALLSIIISLLMISTWGIVQPLSDVQVFGYSPVIPLITIGLLLLKLFFSWEANFERKHGSALVPKSFIKNKTVLSGFYMMLASNLLTGSVAFLVIIYLQLALGLSAAQSGMVFSVIAIGLIIGSIITPKFMALLSQKRFSQLIYILLAVGIVALSTGASVNSFSFIAYFGLLCIGLTAGFLMSFAPVIVTGSLSESEAQQSGGAQATAKNLGGALGIAISGSVLLFSLTGNVQSEVEHQSQMTNATQALIIEQISIPFVSNAQSIEMMKQANISGEEIHSLSGIYAQARLESFRTALYMIILLSIVGLWMTRHIPNKA